MKLLLDTCVSPRTCAALAGAGHDVVWSGDWNPDPGDAEILDVARRESRILITLDKDFGELAVAFGQPHCGIVRLVDLEPARQPLACEQVLTRHGEELRSGAIATVERHRTRIRPPESDGEGGLPQPGQ